MHSLHVQVHSGRSRNGSRVGEVINDQRVGLIALQWLPSPPAAYIRRRTAKGWGIHDGISVLSQQHAPQALTRSTVTRGWTDGHIERTRGRPTRDRGRYVIRIQYVSHSSASSLSPGRTRAITAARTSVKLVKLLYYYVRDRYRWVGSVERLMCTRVSRCRASCWEGMWEKGAVLLSAVPLAIKYIIT